MGTDYGLIDPKEANESSQSQNEEPDEWVKGQEEWANANQSQKEEIRKQDAENMVMNMTLKITRNNNPPFFITATALLHLNR